MKVGIVGAGFVGITTAVVLSEHGHQVFVVENNKTKVEALRMGKLPFFEPNLNTAFRDTLESNELLVGYWKEFASFDPEVTVVCGGTPSRQDGSLDLEQINQIVETFLQTVPTCKNLVIKSTVLPGTSRGIQENISKHYGIKVAMIPEFLREGSALADARNPDRVVIGVNDNHQADLLKSIFAIGDCMVQVMTPFNAEMVKYASNAFLATCISFANEFFSLFNGDSDFDLEDVLDGWHSDRRLTNDSGKAGITNYLKPGFGFGGSCFPKDVRAIASYQFQVNGQTSILNEVLETNKKTIEIAAEWIRESTPQKNELLVVGIAFKEDSDDLRESPALKLIDFLNAAGYQISWFDSLIQEDVEILGCKRITDLADSNCRHIIWTNNSLQYREELRKIAKPTIDLFLLRYQKEISGFNNLKQRRSYVAE
jgi:nucleotide sugar dehydrogenase